MHTTMKVLAVLLFLATIMATLTQGYEPPTTSQSIHLLWPEVISGGGNVPGVSCLSWRLGVETNNVVGWKTIPAECEGYVRHYMLGHQLREDSKVVAREAFLYAKSLNLTKDGNNLWIFDLDETTLSNLPYFTNHGFGLEPFNITSFNEWVYKGEAPALPEILKLYKKLLKLGVKVAIISGRAEDQRNVTITNLKNVGYHTWEKIILKGSSNSGNTALEFKSAEIEKLKKSGYRIIGNIGDQWSDLLGTNVANIRTFKLPGPMYYLT